MSAYATVAEVKSAGGTGTDAEITAAIEEASERVERYTGELFTPTPLTLQLPVGGDGTVHVRKRIQSVTSVTWWGAQTPIVTSAYRVSSSDSGGRDVIGMYGDLSWADVTVLGAEPWNGGWAGLSRGRDPQVVVVGTFGWDAPPYSVRMATALIAAAIRGADLTPDPPAEGEPVTGTIADTEGNVLPVIPPFDRDADTEQQKLLQSGRARSRTTGVLEADVLLASYVREPVRIRA